MPCAALPFAFRCFANRGEHAFGGLLETSAKTSLLPAWIRTETAARASSNPLPRCRIPLALPRQTRDTVGSVTVRLAVTTAPDASPRLGTAPATQLLGAHPISSPVRSGSCPAGASADIAGLVQTAPDSLGLLACCVSVRPYVKLGTDRLTPAPRLRGPSDHAETPWRSSWDSRSVRRRRLFCLNRCCRARFPRFPRRALLQRDETAVDRSSRTECDVGSLPMDCDAHRYRGMVAGLN